MIAVGELVSVGAGKRSEAAEEQVKQTISTSVAASCFLPLSRVAHGASSPLAVSNSGRLICSFYLLFIIFLKSPLQLCFPGRELLSSDPEMCPCVIFLGISLTYFFSIPVGSQLATLPPLKPNPFISNGTLPGVVALEPKVDGAC